MSDYRPIICSECELESRFCRCPSPVDDMAAVIEAAEALMARTLRVPRFVSQSELMQLAVDDVVRSAERITREAADQ